MPMGQHRNEVHPDLLARCLLAFMGIVVLELGGLLALSVLIWEKIKALSVFLLPLLLLAGLESLAPSARAQQQIGPQPVTIIAPVDGSGNVKVNCFVGCVAGGSFADNGTFTAGVTAISLTGGWYSSSPTNCTDGSGCAPQLTIDRKLLVQAFQGTNPWTVNGTVTANQGGAPWSVSGSGNFTVVQATGTNLHTVCDSGCGGAASFADNAAFVAGTTAINLTGGWYSSSPSNCTDGHGCAPQITLDRKLLVQAFQGTSPWVVSGTVTANAGTGQFNVTCTAANCPVNVSQFGGNNLATGTGASGSGIPRVTVANDSNVLATQSGTWTVAGGSNIFQVSPTTAANTNANPFFTSLTDGTTKVTVIAATAALKADLSSVAGTATSTAAAGVQLVGIEGRAGTSLETAAGVLDYNLKNVGNSAVVTSASGVQKVGIVGNANAAMDAANNAAAPANVLVGGFEAESSALGASATAANVRRGIVGLDGVLYTRQGGPLLWSCGVTAIGATLTQCQAAPAASTSLYVTDITAVSDTTTAGAYTLRFGTGSNCGTGTTTLFPAVASITAGKIPYPANSANLPIWHSFATPLKVTAANALCIICIATQTCTASIQGYTAP